MNKRKALRITFASGNQLITVFLKTHAVNANNTTR